MKEKISFRTEGEESSVEFEYVSDRLNYEFVEAVSGLVTDKEVLLKMKLVKSPDGMKGDFGIHCASLGKLMGLKPEEVSRELANKVKVREGGLIVGYSAEGQYLNCILDKQKYVLEVLREVVGLGEKYGEDKLGSGQKVIVDMSSPNIAKRMSVGHLRSTIIGDALSRIYSHLGYEVIKDNHIGDWGTQFGHLLHALETWGDDEVIKRNPIEELQKLYVRVSDAGDPKSEMYKDLTVNEAENLAEEVKNKGRAWFKKLESGDEEAKKKWKMIVDWSLSEFERIYEVLGVSFDVTRGESFYEPELAETVSELVKKGVASESQGALVVNMEDEGLKSAIIRKSDGTTLYMTRDIATALYRNNVDQATKMIYVVGDDQKFYFEQFFGVLKKMDLKVAESSKHVYFGMVRLPDGKMSTRKGRVILLEDVISEAKDRASVLVNQRTRIENEEEKKRLINQVAIGALKWNDLSTDPKKTVVFNWDQMLSLDGNSAPYVQYTFARSCSLLEGAVFSDKIEEVFFSLDSEIGLAKQISIFPQVIKDSAVSYSPSRIATYIYGLSKSFNSYYQSTLILKEPDVKKRLGRLLLTASVAQVIKIGLNLLGIEAPTRM